MEVYENFYYKFYKLFLTGYYLHIFDTRSHD